MITAVRLPGRHPTRSVKPGPPREPPKPPASQPRPTWRTWLLPVVLVIVFLVLLMRSQPSPGVSVSYSQFLGKVNTGQVKTVDIDDKGAVDGTLEDGRKFTTQIPTALDNSSLEQQLRSENVDITASHGGGSGLGTLLAFVLPLVLLGALFLWTGRRAARTLSGGLSGIGRSRAKIIEAERPTTRFVDIAGYEGAKQEISEVVDFLRHPERYALAGAKGPRGVLMVGPPGTGKTLLARAVAGEAEVPFLSVTGSAFVEMFVGVGASRVRDLFADARKRAPSIIFIDEIDAVGSRRGGVRLGGNDEREQTLNQLLAEMDGFDQSSGIVVLAATNRPEALDTALLRPGRFDRHVTVPLPNQAERAAILIVHARGKTLAPDVDWDVVARATPGFSGADLANLVNEAAIHAVRAGGTVISAQDLDSARDRVLLGRRETSNALLPEERHAVAVHESGHALVAALCEHADPVAKVTILPSGPTLGATEQLPEAERHLYSEGYLNDLLTVRLGGRAAELVAFGEGSTGAADDLAGATQIAGRMVRDFGLSPALGPVGYASGTPQRLGGEPPEAAPQRPYSEHTQRIVDEETTRLVRQAEKRAVALLREHRTALDDLAKRLIIHETIAGSTVLDVLRGQPTADDDATTAGGNRTPR
ncbi:ATP-dependent metallopeptidase FtsH/Yme1/Tma family protein [Streptomyces sioyaensis]|uniref:ATP-dependent zinc metalloprotease FtsH n=1 Tax=Streptomyces sioyaensis TaxID=67364 RepID=A0A4Q1RCK7_9ACTN|nr:ATP-dependent zinc metalloprotease FtsH [Streptomyces sioyaensis]MBM4796668.1 ATP-dependent metallopeptidase FtsH/Yme1/Tma family protein [Streptomyces sioyaensis]RXS71581.1 ATP-dependent metallopeptidase FtsH/Yme1/Tma family protein [Streptomyces sioyaensis]